MEMWKKFKHWMKYHPEEIGSDDYWVEFDKEFARNAPIRYFFMEGAFNSFQLKIKFFIQRKIEWTLYRTINRYHVVDSGLKPDYHDIPELILHTNFNLLVHYVEKKLPSLHVWGDREKQNNLYGWKRYFPRFIRRHLKYNRKYSIKYGLDHLDWEMSLTGDVNFQAEDATEIKKLYTWWVEQRPTRKLPESPLDSVSTDHIFEFISEKWKEENPELDAEWKKYCEETRKLEIEWSEEDEQMLIRLMKVRERLF